MLEINQNQSRNLMSTDEKSWKVWENTFADELTIDFGGCQTASENHVQGFDGWAKKTYATVKTQHILFNMDSHLDGDQATSKSYGHARHERADSVDFWHIYAIYEHVRTPNGWKISKIKMTPNFQEGNPKLLDETFALATKS
jgi:hypothetical protein